MQKMRANSKVNINENHFGEKYRGSRFTKLNDLADLETEIDRGGQEDPGVKVNVISVGQKPFLKAFKNAKTTRPVAEGGRS